MKTKIKKIIVCGAGGIGRHHIRIANEHPNFNLVAIVEKNLARLDDLTKKLTVPVLSNIEEAIKKIDFDCAIIATPTNTHFEIAHELLSSNKSILIEKPCSFNSHSIERLKSISIKQNLAVAIAYTERFNVATKFLENYINNDKLGQLLKVEITRSSIKPKIIHKENNVIYDLAVHDLDLLNYLFKKNEVIDSKILNLKDSSFLTEANILLKNSSCNDINLKVTWVTEDHHKVRMYKLYFKDCNIELNFLDGTFKFSLVNNQENLNISNINPEELYRLDFQEEPLKLQLNEFSKLLDNNKNTLASLADGITCLQQAENAIKYLQ